MVEKQTFLHCSILTRKEGNHYVSWCPELDVASCGNGIEEAVENLKDAIDCFLRTYAELGELPKMLAERGISLQEDTPVYLSEARIGVPSLA